ncbi:MAG: galactose mutarotase [Promethearchaeota archaeon]|nr:MAG: galactose mutarotase [Candidatus Lokiarchaeota archaeon]
MQINKTKWGVVDGRDVHIFTISAPKFRVEISDLGATLISVHVPDGDGKVENVTYGHGKPESYLTSPGYFGASIGRVANRIDHAQFELEGQTYKVTPNHKVVHQLHGGKKGFSHKIWSIIKEETGIFDEEARVSMQYVSQDGEEGYPGTLTAKIIYRINPMVIEWEFTAKTNKTTILNLTNHAYWNMNGIHTTIHNLEFTLNARKYSVVNKDLIPTGEEPQFPLDLSSPTTFETIFKIFGDLDHNFFLEKDNPVTAVLYSPKTKRRMQVETTEPCIQVYTGNFMEGIDSFGTQCKKHGAVCLETQKVPNAINRKKYRDWVILKPDEIYAHRTKHTFTVEK